MDSQSRRERHGSAASIAISKTYVREEHSGTSLAISSVTERPLETNGTFYATAEDQLVKVLGPAPGIAIEFIKTANALKGIRYG